MILQWVWLPTFWRSSPHGPTATLGTWKTEDLQGKENGEHERVRADVCCHWPLGCFVKGDSLVLFEPDFHSTNAERFLSVAAAQSRVITVTTMTLNVVCDLGNSLWTTC